jgi:hypothetical protein
VSVEVTPSELDIDPELVAGSAIKHVLDLPKTLGGRNRSLIVRRLTSVTSDGREIFHLYAEKRRMSAQEEFIL